jgi:hypothetical protein
VDRIGDGPKESALPLNEQSRAEAQAVDALWEEM